MGEVVPLTRPKKPKNKFIRSLARESLTEAMDEATKPIAVVIIAIGEDGRNVLKMVLEDEAIAESDVYGRASVVIGRAVTAAVEELEDGSADDE